MKKINVFMMVIVMNFFCIRVDGTAEQIKQLSFTDTKRTVIHDSSCIDKSVLADDTVCIKNCITDDMVIYKKHWAKPMPIFTLKIDGTVINKDESYTVPVDKKMVLVEYECIFKKGWITYHQEKKSIELPIVHKIGTSKKSILSHGTQKQSTVEVRFDWGNKNRLIVACDTKE